jgi:hypothetical protein
LRKHGKPCWLDAATAVEARDGTIFSCDLLRGFDGD